MISPISLLLLPHGFTINEFVIEAARNPAIILESSMGIYMAYQKLIICRSFFVNPNANYELAIIEHDIDDDVEVDIL